MSTLTGLLKLGNEIATFDHQCLSPNSEELHSRQCLGLSLCFLTSRTISETFSVCLEGYSVG